MGQNFIGIGEDDVQRNNIFIAASELNVLKLSNCIMEGVHLLEQFLEMYRIFLRSETWTLRLLLW
jgi:hypothetical protein